MGIFFILLAYANNMREVMVGVCMRMVLFRRADSAGLLA